LKKYVGAARMIQEMQKIMIVVSVAVMKYLRTTNNARNVYNVKIVESWNVSVKNANVEKK
tara:strand:+ start:334 stop:513 length:180 start_codon:yes stop_codon:yes gene_type:complete